ncbi:hypothetical protein DV736_g223, partial [Chaetothyriales sp. CBS 134916]
MTNGARKVKHIHCSGTPYQIGHTHGSEAQREVHGSIVFYTGLFQQRVRLDWSQVKGIANQFLPYLREKNADYVEEMQGLADGAGVGLEDIVGLNVRTEIAYGLLTDGCTAFSWKDGGSGGDSFIGQNWDWEFEQSSNLVCVRIEQGSAGRPTVEMMTEAGIIGKIGMNSAGVGVTLNAIQATGMSCEKLPCHLALRTVLDSKSRAEAEVKLRERGVASACHIQIADKESGGIGFECTSVDVVEMQKDERGITTHTNHLVREHQIQGKVYLKDSLPRLCRVGELLAVVQKPDLASLMQVLKDEQGYPCAINRDQSESSTGQTLFSIVMDLMQGYAKVKIGRPTENGEEFVLRP